MLAGNQQELQVPKSEYNRVVGDIYDDISAVSSDIVDVFPPEMWAQIVKDSLPSRGYNSALLLLTMVSRKWREALVSTCTLWGNIEVRGSQEDSLATIETFTKLSSGILLHLYIYVPTCHDTVVVRSILASIGPRLREVTIRIDTGATLSKQQYFSVFQLLLTSIPYPSSLVCIHLEQGIGSPLYDSATARMIRNIQLPPSLRVISGWHFLWRDFLTSGEYLTHVEDIESYTPMSHVISVKAPPPVLKTLKIYGHISSGLKYEAALEHEDLPQLDNLTTLTYKSAFREGLIQLLSSVAPRLSYLELRLPFVKLPRISAILQAATTLRKLSLQVDSSDTDDLNSGPNG